MNLGGRKGRRGVRGAGSDRSIVDAALMYESHNKIKTIKTTYEQ